MENNILAAKQKLLIENLPEEILNHFYLAGGTALAAFYLEQMKSYFLGQSSELVKLRLRT